MKLLFFETKLKIDNHESKSLVLSLFLFLTLKFVNHKEFKSKINKKKFRKCCTIWQKIVGFKNFFKTPRGGSRLKKFIQNWIKFVPKIPPRKILKNVLFQKLPARVKKFPQSKKLDHSLLTITKHNSNVFNIFSLIFATFFFDQSSIGWSVLKNYTIHVNLLCRMLVLS